MGQNVVAVVVQVGLLLWASRFIDFADPSMLYYLRVGYLVSVGFSMLMFTRVYAKLSQLAAQRGQHEVKKWFVVDQTMFQTAPRVIHRTELEHELAEFWTRLSQLAMQIGIVMFLHLYIGSAEAVLIQGAMNVTECISHTLVQKHIFGRSIDNAWEATDEKPEGAVEVMREGDVATQAQQDAALVTGVNLDDTSQSAGAASTGTPDHYFHPLPDLVLSDTRAKLDKCVLDAWNRNPDREADEICSDIRSFLDVVKSVETDIDVEAANACVNYQTEEGWSMLMVAAGQARTTQVQDMVTALIAARAEPTTHDGDGETCLDWAVNHRNVAAVKSLVECLHRQSNDACTFNSRTEKRYLSIICSGRHPYSGEK
eukprot:INCI1770.2.p1 GENE.INCI1770.2~~INCI1770.2.p1  ORF type:complete len:370 (-),score=60.38 INCI1770.2:49-1158(-)